MAKWTAFNDLLTTCAQLEQVKPLSVQHCEARHILTKKFLQVNLTQTNLRCKAILAEGPRPPPYLKKYIHEAGYKLGRRAVTLVKAREGFVAGKQDSWFPPLHQTTSVASGHNVLRPGFLSKTATILAMSICLGLAGLVLGFAIMAYIRLRAAPQRIQDNAARVRTGVIRYQPEAETTSVEEPIRVIRHQPSRERVFKQIRRRLRRQREHDEESSSETFDQNSANSSSDTLFNEWRAQEQNTSRRVSITLSNGEHRQESLIELECKDGVRNFVDLNTGEMFYIAPWKSTFSDAEDNLDEYNFRKPGDIAAGTIKRAIAEMVTGASALAEGKMVEDKIVEKLKAYRIERHVPQKTGDCLAGEVSNQ
ncbi:MAG: hypothetical protein Q9167_006061 [Letrouitia subvulpina]